MPMLSDEEYIGKDGIFDFGRYLWDFVEENCNQSELKKGGGTVEEKEVYYCEHGMPKGRTYSQYGKESRYWGKCGNTATYFENGKHLCGIHCAAAVRRREEKSEAIRKERVENSPLKQALREIESLKAEIAKLKKEAGR